MRSLIILLYGLMATACVEPSTEETSALMAVPGGTPNAGVTGPADDETMVIGAGANALDPDQDTPHQSAGGDHGSVAGDLEEGGASVEDGVMAALGGSDDSSTLMAGLDSLSDDPCLVTDGDRDGFGTGPACDRLDCDDGNPSVHPESFEACNGQDDDCDGSTDEMLGQRSCGEGECRVLMDNCIDGAQARCAPGMPVQEVCNGLDDDCDGVVDNDVWDATCGVDACERPAACVEGVQGACEPGPPTAELCNGIDDDCDGVVDNAFMTQNLRVPYQELAGLHDGCTGQGAQRAGPACNAAINRFCANQPCAQTGFGPIENSNGAADVTCVGQVEPESVSYADLSQHHSGCNGPGAGYSGPCFAAIHRYCRDTGRVSGFGPLEVGPDELSLGCTPQGTEVRDASYTTMVAIHSGCDGQRQIWGPDCNAAIKRHCRNEGFESGLGPLEHSGDYLAILCFSR